MTPEAFKWPKNPETWLPKSSSFEQQQVKDSIVQNITDRKVHYILEKIDEPDKVEQAYEEKLLKLDNNSLDKLYKLDTNELNNVLLKPQSEIQKYLIQAQIDELKDKGDLTSREKFKLIKLNKELITLKDSTIAVENDKQEQQKVTIAEEVSKQQVYNEVNSNLLSIKGSLNSLKGINNDADKIFKLLESAVQYKIWPNASIEEIEKGADKMNEVLIQIENILKNPVALRSITQDLKEYDQKNWTKTYEKFKLTVQEIFPSLNFEPVDNFDFVWDMAKIKLWANDLKGVELDSDILSQTKDNITTKYSEEDGATQNYNWKDYKVPVEMNPEYEKKVIKLHNQSNEKISPIENNIKVLDNVSKQLDKIKNAGADFSNLKEQTKAQNPDLYNKLWLETKTSYDDVFQEINTQKSELENKKDKIREKADDRITELITQNAKETKERNRNKGEMLKFFNDIAFDALQQTKTDKLIDHMNVNPWSFGLQHKIDINNWNLGFDKDFWDKEINPAEKVSFIKLFNGMLWEDVVDENIAYGTTTLSIEARNRIQVLQNKNTGYFMSNLEKKNNIV